MDAFVLGCLVLTLLGAAGLMAYGVTVLMTGRLPRRAASAWSSSGQAGRWALLMGTALLCLVVAQLVEHTASRMAGSALAVVLVIVALRNRPRGHQPR
jgi:hypothetical protein